MVEDRQRWLRTRLAEAVEDPGQQRLSRNSVLIITIGKMSCVGSVVHKLVVCGDGKIYLKPQSLHNSQGNIFRDVSIREKSRHTGA